MSLTRSLAFRIRRALLCGGSVLPFVLLSQSDGRAADVDGPSRETVEKAIEKAQDYLRSRLEDNRRKNKQDNWEAVAAPVAGDAGVRGARWGELTGLSLLAFSPLDLSNGLVGQDTGGILGYRPDAATAIMRNLLLYAAGVR